MEVLMIIVYGVPFSAHTRKVILCAQHKGIEYEIEPVVPLTPPEGWGDLSPVGKIPALRDGEFTLSDSSVICAYLDRKFPERSIYPLDPRDYARALWIEEYVDGNLQQFVLKQFLLETVFAPAFLHKETDWDVVNNALQVEIPKRFAQLNDWVEPDSYLVAGQLSIADITLASILINFNYGGQRIDADRYPRLARYFDFVLGQEPFRSVLNAEQAAANSVPGFDTGFARALIENSGGTAGGGLQKEPNVA
jgi:glutathione S-transferase